MTDKKNNFAKGINVPRKEPIMIDGVDVSGCKYLPYCEDKQGNCGNNPNCYFKQHKRKEQECEGLENKIKKLRKNLALEIEINDRYRKTLEEIENVWENDEDGDYDFIKFKILRIINKAKDGNDE